MDPSRTLRAKPDDLRRTRRVAAAGRVLDHLPSGDVETMPAHDEVRFAQTLRAVQAYVRAEPGAHAALMETARRDPAGMTASLVSLGTVLLDIAAGAFRLTPDEMLDKVAAHVAEGHHLTLP